MLKRGNLESKHRVLAQQLRPLCFNLPKLRGQQSICADNIVVLLLMSLFDCKIVSIGRALDEFEIGIMSGIEVGRAHIVKRRSWRWTGVLDQRISDGLD